MGLGSFIISFLIPQKQAFLPVFDAIETIFELDRDTLMVRWQWVTARRHRTTFGILACISAQSDGLHHLPERSRKTLISSP
jgi:hypothetical protein